MTPALASACLPLLQRCDPETAHRLALRLVAAGLAGSDRRRDHPSLAVEAFGRRLRNPIGLAAGFDKDAEAVWPLMRLGFGFIEIGTVTPRPQAGNPRPRLFRLREDQAVINRMGFNSAGIDAVLARLRDLPPSRPAALGANIGPNREGAEPERDYPALYAAVAPWVDYVAINVSSPNTPGLRELQHAERLAAILAAMAARRAGLRKQPPLFVKIAPDLSEEALAALIEVAVAQGVAGLIIGNTTLARPAGLRSPLAREAGGLSGQPLFRLSTELLRRAFRLARRRLTLIGVGGIATAEQAYAKIRAGADLIQLYTAFTYAGPVLPRRLADGLAALLQRDGMAAISAAVGQDA